MLHRDVEASEIYEGVDEVVLNALFRLAEKYEV
jgi:alkylation response protein AidB-like acyl-CoA dehydrogenase